jgi:hypothetical protein
MFKRYASHLMEVLLMDHMIAEHETPDKAEERK